MIPESIPKNGRRRRRRVRQTESALTDSHSHSHPPHQQEEEQEEAWSASTAYPYPTDYNDHFETPKQAYMDIQPLLEWFLHLQNQKREQPENRLNSENTKRPESSKDTNNSVFTSTTGSPPSLTIVLYDPYYCNGRTARLLHELGYPNVIHEKRDFYQDVALGTVPDHDILITNPPYSDTHKQKCLEYCFRQLRRRRQQQQGDPSDPDKPFLLLMPAYTASKQYFRDCLFPSTSTNSNSTSNSATTSEMTSLLEDVVYLIPSTSYHYDHPENTGKTNSPFESLWFCGIGRDRISAFQRYWQLLPPLSSSTANTNTVHRRRPTLITSLAGLQERNIISWNNRPNPRQRRGKAAKRQRTAGMEEPLPTNSHDPVAHSPPNPSVAVAAAVSRSIAEVLPQSSTRSLTTTTNSVGTNQNTESKGSTKSRYRDPSSGKRTKKRF